MGSKLGLSQDAQVIMQAKQQDCEQLISAEIVIVAPVLLGTSFWFAPDLLKDLLRPRADICRSKQPVMLFGNSQTHS